MPIISNTQNPISRVATVDNPCEPLRYQLCPANSKVMNLYDNGKAKELVVWVSELSPDVTEEQLKKTFATRFDSFDACRLIQDKSADDVVGYIRFNEPNDQRNALIHMNGFLGLGDKALRITMLAPKHYYANLVKEECYVPHSSNYECSGWSSKPRIVVGKTTQSSFDNLEDDEEENRIIEYNIPVNVDGLNTEYLSRSEEVWDSVEKDRWLYDLDNENGFVPHFD